MNLKLQLNTNLKKFSTNGKRLYKSALENLIIINLFSTIICLPQNLISFEKQLLLNIVQVPGVWGQKFEGRAQLAALHTAAATKETSDETKNHLLPGPDRKQHMQTNKRLVLFTQPTTDKTVCNYMLQMQRKFSSVMPKS